MAAASSSSLSLTGSRDSWSWTDTTSTNRSIVLRPSTRVRLAPVQPSGESVRSVSEPSEETEEDGTTESSDFSVSSLLFLDPPSYETDVSSSNESLEFNPADHLMHFLPSRDRWIHLNTLEGKDYSPVELYEALGNAMDEVTVQEKWKMAEAEDPIERASRIGKLRAENEIRSAAAAAPEAFSRACGVCFTEAPRVRAMLTTCGHLLCAWCAETLADGKGGRLVCPYCRENTGFIVLVEEEEEEGSPATDDDCSDAETNERIDSEEEIRVTFYIYWDAVNSVCIRLRMTYEANETLQFVALNFITTFDVDREESLNQLYLVPRYMREEASLWKKVTGEMLSTMIRDVSYNGRTFRDDNDMVLIVDLCGARDMTRAARRAMRR